MEKIQATTAAGAPRLLGKSPADGLEQAFLSEMLKYAGSTAAAGEFGGGAGESQFASMLNDAYAQAIAERIDLGLQPARKVRG
ncbi:rod-binding protein [Paracoccus thiocyanatus]|nr:rod-binding protein [Paracoccus thiocyanatus]